MLRASIYLRKCCGFSRFCYNTKGCYLSNGKLFSFILMAMLGISFVQLFECFTITHFLLSKTKGTDLYIFFQTRSKSKESSLVMWNFLDAPRKFFRTAELTKDSTTNLQLQASRNASIARIFGKLAEDRVLIDVSQGKCCFSGCPGCDFYKDDGTYQYEEFRAFIEGSFTDANKVPQSPEPLSVKCSKAVPAAWIPVYSYRFVGGPERHVAKWTRVLFPMDQDKSLCKDLFCQRLLDYTDGTPISFPVIECDDVLLTYPPKSNCVKVSDITLLKDPYFLFGNPAIHNSTKMIKKVENDKYDTEVIEALWRLMAAHGSSVTKRQIANRFKKWNEGTNDSLEGIGFSSFAKKMLQSMPENYGKS